MTWQAAPGAGASWRAEWILALGRWNDRGSWLDGAAWLDTPQGSGWAAPPGAPSAWPPADAPAGQWGNAPAAGGQWA